MKMMRRRFIPVGHGAFYCESFFGGEINVVYDCGSMEPKKVEIKEIVEKIFEKNEKIDALFISHFDRDHINGIPYLLKHCNVKNIFFPILTPSCKEVMRIYFNIMYKSKKIEDDEYQFLDSFINNPIEVISSINSEKNIRTNVYFISAYIDGEDNQYEYSDNIIVSGENIWKYITKQDNEYLWKYIPYNIPNKEVENKIREEIEKVFGKDITLQGIVEKLKKGETDINVIKKLYKVLEGKTNINSMVLFSGTDNYNVYSEIRYPRHRCCFRNCNCLCRIPAGFLYTGDYDAKNEDNWEYLFLAYITYWEYIGGIQLPHHGSNYNYNTQLTDDKISNSISGAYTVLNNMRYAIASVKEDDSSHPGQIALKDLIMKNKDIFIITEKEDSEVVFEVYHTE